MSNAPTHSVHSAIATGPLLLLLFLLFGCLAPGAAFAVDGYDHRTCVCVITSVAAAS